MSEIVLRQHSKHEVKKSFWYYWNTAFLFDVYSQHEIFLVVYRWSLFYLRNNASNFIFFFFNFVFISDIYLVNTNKQMNKIKLYKITNFFIWKCKFAGSLLKTKIVLSSGTLQNKLQSWKWEKNWRKLIWLVHYNLRRKSKSSYFCIFFKSKNNSTWGSTHNSVSRIRRSSQRRCSVKKIFLDISKISRKNTCARVSCLDIIKKETLAQVFFCKFS